LFVARIAIAMGMLAGIAFSLPLWLTRQTYPRAPLFGFIPALPSPLDALFLLAFAATFALLIWRRQLRGGAVLWLFAAAFLVAQDQSRLQPWFVEGVLLLAALVFAKSEKTAFDGCRLVVAAIYFWSGVHKMNDSFVNALFPWLVSPVLPSLKVLGAIVPFFEMGMGLALLFPRARRIAVVGIAAMHLFLLFVLGPWALGWNSVVWPWNFTMMLLVGCLFWTTEASPKALLDPRGEPVRIALLAFILILPPLSLAELWDTSPSFDLYSGDSLIASVILVPDAWERLDSKTKAVAERAGEGYRLRLDDWAISETNVPAYPAERVLRTVAQSFCSAHRQGNDVVFLVEKPARWFYRPGWHRIEESTELCKV
jgi:hypothetical protein